MTPSSLPRKVPPARVTAAVVPPIMRRENAARRPAAPSSSHSVFTERVARLPVHLRAGVETLSGVSLDDVRVHYNSPKPAQVDALAYAHGAEIHVAPGQERHVPHEAWHVVQQKQGRVKPTLQAKGWPVNDDRSLEGEANVMGMRAASTSAFSPRAVLNHRAAGPPHVMQRVLIDGKGHEHDAKTSERIIDAFKASGYYVHQLVPLYGQGPVDTELRAIQESKAISVAVSEHPLLGFDTEANHQSLAQAMKARLGKPKISDVPALHEKAVMTLDAMRNPKEEFKRGAENKDATLTSELSALLWKISADKDSVSSTLEMTEGRYHQSTLLPSEIGYSSAHRLTFSTGDTRLRYVRFVKAAKLTGNDLSFTQEGYVRFVQGKDITPKKILIDKKIAASAVRGNIEARQALRATVKRTLDEVARWSYDGPSPKHELSVVNEKLQNIDEPGEDILMWRHLPYMLATQFVGVLYDPVGKAVVNITRYDDVIAEFGESYPILPKTNTDVTDVLTQLNLKDAKAPITEDVIETLVAKPGNGRVALIWLFRSPEYPLDKWTGQGWSRFLDWLTTRH